MFQANPSSVRGCSFFMLQMILIDRVQFLPYFEGYYFWDEVVKSFPSSKHLHSFLSCKRFHGNYASIIFTWPDKCFQSLCHVLSNRKLLCLPIIQIILLVLPCSFHMNVKWLSDLCELGFCGIINNIICENSYPVIM